MAISSAARYRRVTAVLDERARQRLWSSGGCCGAHTGGTSPELADLVDSFYAGGGGRGHEKGGERRGEEGRVEGVEREVLVGLVGRRDEEEGRVLEEVEAAVGRIGVGGEGAERKVVWWLRRRGFDAGLCQSKPDDKSTYTTAPFPLQRRHLYVDVVTPAKTRYIVELNLAAEFEIARPTPEYLSLLAALPRVFVGRPKKLRDVVRLLCTAAATSMRSRGMHVPPWRRKEYVQAKWLGPYDRITSLVLSNGCVGGGGGGEEEEEMVRRRRVVVGCRSARECGGEGLRRAAVGKLR